MAINVLLNPIGVLRRFDQSLSLPLRLFTSLPMNSKVKSSYEEAVYTLNGLQSNAAYLVKAREERSKNAHKSVTDTKKHLNTLGIQVKDLDALNIIHVSGTKGKGSTCAFTESIIRHHGFKTGFYSSPHLISVNERIRINGQSLDKDVFSEYFWEVYRTLQNNLKSGEKMPPYFQFLTVMAFYIFVKEKVQAAVVEVGIGGLYDCTNIICKPIVVGVTTLGLDHVSLLGNTITQIAEQKAGIFKQNVPVFTVSQPENAMDVLFKEAESKACSLRISPPFEFYQKSSNSFSLGASGIVQNLNASLALQLSKAWLDQTQTKDDASHKAEYLTEYRIEACNPLSVAEPFDLNPIFEKGLLLCDWPGRFQTIEKDHFTFYLDGAHTQQSIKYCARWFEETGRDQRSKFSSPVLKVLIFNCTGDRKAEALLDPLSDLHFDLVLFSPNRLSVMKDSASDLSNFMVDSQAEMQQCVTNKGIWCHLKNSLYEDKLSSDTQPHSISSASPLISEHNDETRTLVFSCLKDAMDWLTNGQNSNYQKNSMVEDYTYWSSLIKSSSHVQVLVTGSLHLVGGVLSIIQT